jgi:hypothetical protein
MTTTAQNAPQRTAAVPGATGILTSKGSEKRTAFEAGAVRNERMLTAFTIWRSGK